MSTESVQENILYGIGEGDHVEDADYLAYALRWANAGYREIINRYNFKTFIKKANFTMTDGQQTYQAPTDFKGFLVLKDETNGTNLSQITPEEFQRSVSANSVSDEAFTSASDTAVSLDYKAIVQYSEVITDYTRDTDYSMNYATGTITMDSGGSMVNDTEYEISYLYHIKGDPIKFCIEYDATNKLYVFRLDPVPDDSYIGTLVYPAYPANLSSSVGAIWDRFEFALEMRGKYFGALEMFDANDKRTSRFDIDSEKAIQALIQLDMDLIPKNAGIRVIMRRSDY